MIQAFLREISFFNILFRQVFIFYYEYEVLSFPYMNVVILVEMDRQSGVPLT